MPTRRSRHSHSRRNKPEKAAVTKFEAHWAQRPHRRQIPEAEKLLLSFLIILMVVLPWAVGSAHIWTQLTVAVFAFVCLVISLIPHDLGDDPSDSAIKRLLRFPVFWLGLLLLAYVGTQALNPGYRVEQADEVFWLSPQENMAVLPSGVAASLFAQGSLRTFLVLLIPFLTVCAMWAGLTRRRSTYILLWVMVLNGLALSGVAILQAYTNAKEVLWFLQPHEGEPFISTFLHAPHAAAYFLTLVGPTLGFAAHYYFQAKRTFERSSPSGLFAFTGIVFLLMLLFSYQPIAAAAAGFLMVLLLYFILHKEFLTEAPGPQKALVAALGLVVMLIGAGIAYNVAGAHAERRAPGPEPLAMSEAEADGEGAGDQETETETAEVESDSAPAGEGDEESGASDEANGAAAEERGEEEPATVERAAHEPAPGAGEWAAAWEMFQDHWLFGAGAGSFPYLFPEYAERPPPDDPQNPKRILVGSDWFRLPAELGLVGTLLVLALCVVLLLKVIHHRLIENPIPLFSLLGLLGVILLAGARVVFDNPAVLVTWLGLLTVSALVIRIETSRVVVEGRSGLSSE